MWASSTHLGPSGEVFNLHAVVDWVELQLWNHFDNGFDVFLGKASVSLHQLQEQCSDPMTREKTQDSATTGALWFPLQTSEANGLMSQLSLQIECSFTSDPKVRRVREEIRQRRKRKARGTKKRLKQKTKTAGVGAFGRQEEASESGEDIDENDSTSIADPAFAFTQPFLPVEWSLVASTSIRQLFFHSEVERLANFREFVLYGDLEQELDNDEGLQIHEDHLTAFKTCQFSAQYLDHCVENLSQRLQHYSDDHHVLADTRAQLTRKNKSWKAQRRRLQKENDDLDLLIATYKRVLEKNGDAKVSEDHLKQPASPTRGDSSFSLLPESVLASPPSSPTPSLSPKKPVFLKTWEERERERRLEKEVSKAQRIEEEKQRFLQRVLKRHQREDYEAFISKFAENRKQRAARRIQAFFRSIKSILQVQRYAVENHAAILLQAVWKRFVHVKEYPHRVESRKQEAEMLLMAQSEGELRQWMAAMEQQQREEAIARAMSPPESIQSNDSALSPLTSPSKEIVDALVATWRKLHRVFVLAHKTKGTDYHALFSEIDLRKDDVLDRAELRLGAKSFGVRLDRKITRALITLIRTKCGAPSKPLLVTFEQFMQGFELLQTEVELADTKRSPGTKLESFTDASGKGNNPLDTGGNMLTGQSPNSHQDQANDDEALVMAVRAFRAAIYESATAFLTVLGKSSTDYRAFRDALAHIFYEFDADRNGELDVDELVTCMSSFNLQLSSENISLLRELFIGDRESDTVGAAEFISFVLAHSSSSSDEDELGLLGYRIREAIMARVSQAQAQAENIEDAVRLVFGAAYKRKDQQRCSIQDFMRVLGRLRLGVTRAQIARLVVRLDRDGDRSISFDELLIWLRMRSKRLADGDLAASPGRATASQMALQIATKKAKALRILLDNLASGSGFSASLVTPGRRKNNLTALFRQIDRDNSGKINQEELQTFLESQNLPSMVGDEVLAQLCGVLALPQYSAASVAHEMMALLDLNANGVTTLKEWLTFAQYENTEDGEDPVVIEAMRTALKGSENDDPERLMLWFSELPGGMQVTTARAGEPVQMKIRVAEFKTALRAKLGGARSISLRTIDRVVASLDKDNSGWITTSELCSWAFPPRDLEEILRLVIKSWQIEHQKISRTDLAADLYKRFDADGNGCLAVRELLQGFMSFGVILTEYEARVLLVAFDLDGDSCWSKSEFMAFVDKLFPTEPLVDEPDETTKMIPPEPAETLTVQISSHGSDPGGNSSAFSDSDLLVQSGSSNALSSPAYSDDEEVGVRPTEYSEDFDD
ncbi:hypothetical protein KRP22_009516 [Phytophthora ramorum]|uniref:uncharacterized protein n=1 Tax=Phytophthora ramorum TaxID=164328 RepID=UPI00309E6DE0|nr:hypothetical protein KRP23_13694 [Phytophthora ramorum]KAH7481614.1 hypothetical protein KRP23_4792 [Phytophthora ramorum]KAH7502889.1 hypothetical protein KRP22_8349 [Phytophthora ramorum]